MFREGPFWKIWVGFLAWVKKTPLCELIRMVEKLFCVTDVGQVYLAWLPVGALVHLCGVAKGLEFVRIGD